ncbi:MAG: PepSY domain-containing protein [Gammaproteobacteria bacterium]|nr:PepSY domain-containing protein [Gammaproteobacteria bacterium]
MKKLKNTLAIGTLGVVLLSAGVATAGDRHIIAPTDYSLDLMQASELALAQVPGDIQSLELEKEDGKIVWEVKVASADQQRHKLIIDANTGEVLENKLKKHRSWFGDGE